MGEEKSLPSVEEPAEPLICGSREHNIFPTLLATQPPVNVSVPSFDLSNKENISLQEALSLPPLVDTPSANLDITTNICYENWSELYQAAHTLTALQVAQALGVNPQNGLTDVEAESRLRENGPNKVEGAEGVSLWKILLRQVSNSLTLVLVMTMGLSFGINDYIEGGVITAVILLNVVVGFLQDYHAEKTIMSLYALSAPMSKVIREGRITTIKAEMLVVGDTVQLAVGDVVPADLRLVDGMNVSIDEALLTGESLPASKTPLATFADKSLPLGDRSNMAFSASIMTAGRGTGIVISTGMRTEVGKIADLLRRNASGPESSKRLVRALKSFQNGIKNILGLVGTPLQIKLSKFALLLFGLAILLAIIVFSANKWNVSGEVLIYGICVAVAVIPESLIAVLTITVAMGTKEMSKGNVIVRKLQALEAVGGVTNICSDKTGTLTQGKMIAHRAWIPGIGNLTVHETTSPFNPASGHLKLNDDYMSGDRDDQPIAINTFMKAIALCNLSSVYRTHDKYASSLESSEEWTAVGEPTEIALHVLALRLNMGRLMLLKSGDMRQEAEFPFDSAGKRMTVVYRNTRTGAVEAFMKGATEVVLPLLSNSDQERDEICSVAEKMASEGLRVLCVAHKVISVEEDLSERHLVEQNLQFTGLVGLYDPPRLETAEAVRRCQLAGIIVHMLTGDHIRTATAIAHKVGILNTAAANADRGTAIMSAEEFDKLSDAEIDAIDTLPLVLARCSPTTKVRVVEAMHRRKAFCVMTGDGVNDSPALKHADVGIAMGLNGSDVAKEAADMVLTDDNFASIVKAVEEGRRLFDNIQKFLMHLLISNIAQVILLLIALAFKDADNHSVFPLSPLEILWVNLVTSSFLALGLGLEEAQADIMFRPPHDLSVGVFTRELITDKFIYGFFMGSLCLLSFVSIVYGSGGGDLGSGCNDGWNSSCDIVFRARSTTYATLSFLLLVTAWEVKHFSRSLFDLDPTSEHSGPFSIFHTVWCNRFLFWAVVAGFTITFPVVYIPVVNRQVFKHSGITWEWGIVLSCVVVYVALVETWKALKRRFGIGNGKIGVLTRRDAEMRAGLEGRATTGSRKME